MVPLPDTTTKKFLGIWRRALALPALSDLHVELVSNWAQQAGFTVQDATERDVGIFQHTRAIVLSTNLGVACFPKALPKDAPQWKENRVIADHHASLWQKVEWFSPLWITRGAANKLLMDVEHRSKDEAISLFNYHTSTL